MPKVALCTIGCKLNQYETELVAHQLQRCDFTRVPWDAEADLYIINSCMVTRKAAADSRHKLFAARRKSAGARVVVIGCYAQLQAAQLADLTEVDLVVGNDERDQLIPRLCGLFPDLQTKQLPSRAALVGKFYRHSRALIKIQNGCNQNCSYCVVPLARGREQSRALPEIISEVCLAIQNEYKEIVLTGVHIGRYNFEDLTLADLIDKLLNETEIPRIRLSSIEVNEIDDRLMMLAADHPRICPHFHIPLQSGSDRVLTAMRRPYRAAQYLERAKELKSMIANVMIGADVIAGFPGESESEFGETMAFVENGPLDYLHVFSYSDHPETASYGMIGKLAPQTIRARNQMLTELGQLKWAGFLESQMNRTLPVLFEKRMARQSGRLTGLSDNYIRVESEGTMESFNTIQNVEPLTISGRKLIGKIASNK